MPVKEPTATLPAITTTHEWIRLNLGNNRGLSCSYGGAKATGSIPEAVWSLWADAHDFKATAMVKLGLDAANTSHGAIVEAFKSQIDTLWPEWNVPPVVPKVGDPISYDFGKRRGGMDKGVVESVRRTMVTVRFTRMGLIVIPADMLAEA